MDMIPGRTNRLSLAGRPPGHLSRRLRRVLRHLARADGVRRHRARTRRRSTTGSPREAAPSPGVDAPGREAFLAEGCGACHTVRGTEARRPRRPRPHPSRQPRRPSAPGRCREHRATHRPLHRRSRRGQARRADARLRHARPPRDIDAHRRLARRGSDEPGAATRPNGEAPGGAAARRLGDAEGLALLVGGQQHRGRPLVQRHRLRLHAVRRRAGADHARRSSRCRTTISSPPISTTRSSRCTAR